MSALYSCRALHRGALEADCRLSFAEARMTDERELFTHRPISPPLERRAATRMRRDNNRRYSRGECLSPCLYNNEISQEKQKRELMCTFLVLMSSDSILTFVGRNLAWQAWVLKYFAIGK